MQLVDDAMI